MPHDDPYTGRHRAGQAPAVRRPRRSLSLVRPIRTPADPGPATELLAVVPVAPPQPAPMAGRCGCGRFTAGRSCCGMCEAATAGGWTLGPYHPGARWTDVHSADCEAKQVQRDPQAAYIDAAWNAGSAPAAMTGDGNALYQAERARQLAGRGDPQSAGTPGDHRQAVAELMRPCATPVSWDPTGQPDGWCGGSALVHNLTETGKRTRCTAGTAAGWCPCRAYNRP